MFSTSSSSISISLMLISAFEYCWILSNLINKSSIFVKRAATVIPNECIELSIRLSKLTLIKWTRLRSRSICLNTEPPFTFISYFRLYSSCFSGITYFNGEYALKFNLLMSLLTSFISGNSLFSSISACTFRGFKRSGNFLFRTCCSIFQYVFLNERWLLHQAI